MDESRLYMNVQLVKLDSPSLSGNEADISYAEIQFKTLSDPRVRTNRDRLTSPDSELNIGKDEQLIDEDEDPSILSRSRELRISAQTDEPDVSYAEIDFKAPSDPRFWTNTDCLTSPDSELNIGKDEQLSDEDEDPSILSRSRELRVSAKTERLTTRDSELNFRKDEHLIDKDENPPILSRLAELRVTALTAVLGQLSKVKIGNRPYRLLCLLGLVTSALIVIVIGLSIHASQNRQSSKQMHSDLRHQYTEMETKYRFLNKTNGQLCEFLTSRKEQTCSENWVRNKGRCYYVSTFETSLHRAIQECSKRDSRLLEINSSDEARFVARNIMYRNRMYWIGKCENRNVSFGLLYKDPSETSVCSQCDPTAVSRRYPCDRDQRFICEKSAPVFPDVPEKIQGLCRHPVERT